MTAAQAPSRASVRLITVRHGIAVIVVLALAVRVIVVLATPHFRPNTDSADYDREAASLVDSGSFPPSLLSPRGGPSAFRPPAFPLVLAGVYELSGTGSRTARWEAGRLAEAVLGALTVLLTSLIALRLFGTGAALVSGAVAAVYPPLILIGSSLMSESLFVPLVLGSVLAGLLARESEHPLPWAAVTGAIVGAAALTRSVGIIAVLPLIALVWSRGPRRSLRAVSVPLVLIGAVVVVLIPWTVRNAIVLRSFVPISTENGFALAGTYNPATRSRRDYPALWYPPVPDQLAVVKAHPHFNEAQISSALTGDALRYIRAHPGYLGEVAFWTAVRLLNLEGPGLERYEAQFEAYPPELAVISVYSFWVVGLLALLALLTRQARGSPFEVWFVPGLIILATLFFAGSTRYRAPADPFIVILAGLGLLVAFKRLRRVREPPIQRLPSAAG